VRDAARSHQALSQGVQGRGDQGRERRKAARLLIAARQTRGAAQTPEAAIDRFLTALKGPAHILIAVSGGSDSTGLLVALAERIKSRSITDIILSAATIDHELRAGSAAEARQVAALCARLAIRHVTRLWQGEKPKTGLMAAAREARYGLLVKTAAELCANLIVTAHTLDDQEETLAMRSKRRTVRKAFALTGIADAVLFDRRIWVVRPLLGCRRREIRLFLSNRGVDWIDDPSNEDPRYERVRVRRQLEIEAPSTAPANGITERTMLAEAAAAWLTAHVAVHSGLIGEVSREGLAGDSAVVTFALSYLAAALGGQAFPPGRMQFRRILDFLSEGSSGRRTIAGVVFDLRRGGLYLMRENRSIAPVTVLPGERTIWDGRFEISNGCATALEVSASAKDIGLILPGRLPRGVLLRAQAVAPRLSVTGGGAQEIEKAQVVPYLAPFDHFLTCFDLTFANRLADAFGRTPYLPLPL
jgi:tRNA(Ile)-lysidine synthase